MNPMAQTESIYDHLFKNIISTNLGKFLQKNGPSPFIVSNNQIIGNKLYVIFVNCNEKYIRNFEIQESCLNGVGTQFSFVQK